MTIKKPEPVAYLIPVIESFKDCWRTSLTKEMQEKLEGTVLWKAGLFSDSPGVTDKFGETHCPKPLFTESDMEAYAQARVDAALERAAVECEEYEQKICKSRENNRAQHFMGAMIGASACADKIRALKGKV